jgi:hypothetical protein
MGTQRIPTGAVLWQPFAAHGTSRCRIDRIDRQASQKENLLKSNPRLSGCLLAALVLSSAIAQADNGFTISRSRENAVAIGMSASEVQQLLGRPARAVQYRNQPGPTWTYKVTDPLFGKTEFNIDFGPDQRVIAKGEMVIGSEKPSG